MQGLAHSAPHRPRSWRRSTKLLLWCGVVTRCVLTSSREPEPLATSFLAEPLTLSMSGSNCKLIDDKGQIVFLERAVAGRWERSSGGGCSHVPLLSPRRAREPDQQAERLGSSIRFVCSTDSAGSR